jgi:hypothetical protein
MSFTRALYEGDSVIHSEFRAGTAVNPRIAGTRRVWPPATVLEIAELAMAELKGWTVLIDVVQKALRSVGLWLEQKSSDAHYRRVESYLAQSSNHADLERRMRELEHSNRLNWIDSGSR